MIVEHKFVLLVMSRVLPAMVYLTLNAWHAPRHGIVELEVPLDFVIAIQVFMNKLLLYSKFAYNAIIRA